MHIVLTVKQMIHRQKNEPVSCGKSFACLQHAIALLYQLNIIIHHTGNIQFIHSFVSPAWWVCRCQVI